MSHDLIKSNVAESTGTAPAVLKSMRVLLILILTVGYAAADDHGRPHLPSVPVNNRVPLTPEKRTELGNLSLSPATFIEEFTNHGVLYHGMPDINAMNDVYRRGFLASREKGISGRDGGWGLFTTRNFGRALGHGNRISMHPQGDDVKTSDDPREFGVIFPLTIKPSNDLRVIDLQRDHHAISNLIKRYDVSQTRHGWYDVFPAVPNSANELRH